MYHVRFHELGYHGKFFHFILSYIHIWILSGKVLLTLDHWNLKLCTFYKQLKNITNEREKILFKNTYVHLIQFMNIICFFMTSPSCFCFVWSRLIGQATAGPWSTDRCRGPPQAHGAVPSLWDGAHQRGAVTDRLWC